MGYIGGLGFVYVFHGDWDGSLICSLLHPQWCGAGGRNGSGQLTHGVVRGINKGNNNVNGNKRVVYREARAG